MLDGEDDYFLEEDKLTTEANDDVPIIFGEDALAEISSGDMAPSQPFVGETPENNVIIEDPLPLLVERPREELEYLMDPLVQHNFQDLLGMTVTSGVVNIKKDTSNLIGISIGGGAPYCPCLYIVQVFDNTPASREGTLQSGDELLAVNSQSVKGKTKVEVAKMIQACQNEVNIKYNKLHADPVQGKTLDIVLKKVKHRLVENMSGSTADALGLSRAILCNDTLVKKLQELQSTENMYRGLVEHTKRVMKAFYSLLQVYKGFGDAFAEIGVREPQARASEAFSTFGDYHRLMEKNGIQTLKQIRPILSDLGTYLHKAIPDTKLTIRKYADAKFEYLSYCLKVKEMDDEEYSYAALQEPLYRVETGNYEYRLVLRCRQEARAKFAKLRSDVLEKLELLDNKHVQDIGHQLESFIGALVKFYTSAEAVLNSNTLFPIEMDLSTSAFQYASVNSVVPFEDEEDDEMLQVEETEGGETETEGSAEGMVELIHGLDTGSGIGMGSAGVDLITSATDDLGLDGYGQPDKDSFKPASTASRDLEELQTSHDNRLLSID